MQEDWELCRSIMLMRQYRDLRDIEDRDGLQRVKGRAAKSSLKPEHLKFLVTLERAAAL